jgi:hypothetical protein
MAVCYKFCRTPFTLEAAYTNEALQGEGWLIAVFGDCTGTPCGSRNSVWSAWQLRR